MLIIFPYDVWLHEFRRRLHWETLCYMHHTSVSVLMKLVCVGAFREQRAPFLYRILFYRRGTGIYYQLHCLLDTGEISTLFSEEMLDGIQCTIHHSVISIMYLFILYIHVYYLYILVPYLVFPCCEGFCVQQECQREQKLSHKYHT